jgi:hypothetical protein
LEISEKIPQKPGSYGMESYLFSGFPGAIPKKAPAPQMVKRPQTTIIRTLNMNKWENFLYIFVIKVRKILFYPYQSDFSGDFLLKRPIF